MRENKGNQYIIRFTVSVSGASCKAVVEYHNQNTNVDSVKTENERLGLDALEARGVWICFLYVIMTVLCPMYVVSADQLKLAFLALKVESV